jgi:hypothetical protein
MWAALFQKRVLEKPAQSRKRRKTASAGRFTGFPVLKPSGFVIEY